MKPIHQTKFGAPDGNCFSACVASVLELPLDDVPHLPSQGYEVFQRFLAPLGFQYMESRISHLDVLVTPPTIWPCDTYVILTGPSPNVPGADHSVVARARAHFKLLPHRTGRYGCTLEEHWRDPFEVVHDPNPQGKPFDPETAMTVGFFVRTGDPV